MSTMIELLAKSSTSALGHTTNLVWSTSSDIIKLGMEWNEEVGVKDSKAGNVCRLQ